MLGGAGRHRGRIPTGAWRTARGFPPSAARAERFGRSAFLPLARELPPGALGASVPHGNVLDGQGLLTRTGILVRQT
jgi:hypothetical protein